MRLRDEQGFGAEVRVTGYQFPDAADPRQRFSWHVLEGDATSPEGHWDFRWQALTCDETPRVAEWMRTWAGGVGPDRLAFVEPNLAFAVVDHGPDWVQLRIELNLEFSPPWTPDRRLAGEPYGIVVQLPKAALLAAADAWLEAAAPYPDGLAEGSM